MLFSNCKNQKKQTKIEEIKQDTLLITPNDSLNKIIKKYYRYEMEYISYMKKNDIDISSLYADSSNYYNNLLFQNPFINKLRKKDLVLYNRLINNIRKNKIKELEEITKNK